MSSDGRPCARAVFGTAVFATSGNHVTAQSLFGHAYVSTTCWHVHRAGRAQVRVVTLGTQPSAPGLRTRVARFGRPARQRSRLQAASQLAPDRHAHPADSTQGIHAGSVLQDSVSDAAATRTTPPRGSGMLAYQGVRSPTAGVPTVKPWTTTPWHSQTCNLTKPPQHWPRHHASRCARIGLRHGLRPIPGRSTAGRVRHSTTLAWTHTPSARTTPSPAERARTAPATSRWQTWPSVAG